MSLHLTIASYCGNALILGVYPLIKKEANRQDQNKTHVESVADLNLYDICELSVYIV